MQNATVSPFVRLRYYTSELEPLAKGGLLLAAGTAAVIAQSTLSVPLLGAGISLCCGVIALKAYSAYNRTGYTAFSTEAVRFHRSYPAFQLITVVALAALYALSAYLSLIAAIALGVYGSMILHLKQHQRLQTITLQPAQTVNIRI